MGDKLVDAVLEAWKSLAFANGIDVSTLRPFADDAVNRLRNAGLLDVYILAALTGRNGDVELTALNFSGEA